MNLETKITIYKFTPQLFTLTLIFQIYHHDNTLIDIKTEKGSINH